MSQVGQAPAPGSTWAAASGRSPLASGPAQAGRAGRTRSARPTTRPVTNRTILARMVFPPSLKHPSISRRLMQTAGRGRLTNAPALRELEVGREDLAAVERQEERVAAR